MTETQEQKQIRQNKDKNTNMNTISTKLSTDQLICKTPQDSPNSSVKSLGQIRMRNEENSLLCLGVLQFAFGFLMMLSGGLVLHYDASLAQLGGGIWAGCLSMATGIIGVLASAKEWCPLKSTPQKITHTVFLALSLVSLAIAQLVVALAATGITRDFNNSDYDDEKEVQVTTTQIPPGKISIVLPENYLSILANLGLLLSAAGEFVVAAVSSYKSSRALCPCFRRTEDYIEDLNARNRNALVSSWLGKQSPPHQIYVVATGAPSSLGKGSKLSGGLPVAPIFTLPQHQVAPSRVVRYPLIPAPLGTIPSPIIPPSPPLPARDMLRHKMKKNSQPKCAPSKSKSKSKEKVITEEDVVRTYTGLDKAIAEEFIDMCDSRNVSLCSDSSCNSSCQCQRSCNGCNTNSEAASRDFLVNKD